MTQPTSIESDAEIMAKIARGDSEAERQLIAQHFPRMYGLACRILADQSEAEDVCQEAFIRLWNVAEQWAASAKLSTWLYRVVHNLCVDCLRKRRHFLDNGTAEVEDIVDGRQTYIEEHASSQTADIVNAAIMALPERQRTAITLVYHHEMGNIEAAEVMDITVEALESLLSRGRRKLRDTLFDKRRDLI